MGQRGQAKEHPLNMGESEEEQVRQILRPAIASGYAPVDESDEVTVCVVYKIEGFDSKEGLQKRHALEERLNATLGWTGLGHCDGGSNGSGTMEVFCMVVDLAIARRVIAEDLTGTEYGSFVEIRDE
jgi:hypothetical protein